MERILKIVISKGAAHDLSASRNWLTAQWQDGPKSTPRRLFGLQEHVSLEILGRPEQVQFQIWVPYPAVARVVSDQLRAHFPDIGIHFVKEDVPTPIEFATAELVLGMNRERSLKTLKTSEADPMAGILASISGLSANERAMIQILVTILLGVAIASLVVVGLASVFPPNTKGEIK